MQASWSSQSVEPVQPPQFEMALCWQAPLVGSQASAVQASASSQLTGWTVQLPVAESQLPIKQGAAWQLTGLLTHPSAESQESVVHRLPSLQLTGSCLHPVVASQESAVQTSPSSHGLEGHTPPAPQSASWVQLVPDSPWQVRMLQSKQFGSPVCMQPPVAGSQASVVQALPSSQEVWAGWCPHAPVAESQASVVQALPSSQVTCVFMHPAEPHESVVQGSWSSQLIGSYLQLPVAASQESLLQGLASSQLFAVWVHCRLTHASVVQASPSPQSASRRQQLGVVAPTQAPAEQASGPVHSLPSSQPPEVGVAPQCPVAGSQASAVQTLPSSHVAGAFTQAPVWESQVSAVQRLWSSQSRRVLVQRFPTQASVVHWSWSMQSAGLRQQLAIAVPTQAPPEQVSAVQELPSSHAPAIAVYTQAPVVGLQASAVQTLLSLQLRGAECWQVPSGLHVSVVQALPSLHTEPNSLQSLAQGPGKSPCATWAWRAAAPIVMVWKLAGLPGGK